MNERMRFNPAEAGAAGQADARSLLLSIGDGDIPTGQLNDAISEIIALAIENRIEECEARKTAFCEVIGPALRNVVGTADQLEAPRVKCALLSASLRQADEQTTGITDSEGGEL